jgi:ADP-glucose pyrophosphorylase
MFKEVWWELYKNAILGTDGAKLDKVIIEAELAIRERCKLNGQVSKDEKSALCDALAALAVVKREQSQASNPSKPYQN